MIISIMVFSYEVKRKHSSGNKHVNESQKLRYKHKKEFKVQLHNDKVDGDISYVKMAWIYHFE